MVKGCKLTKGQHHFLHDRFCLHAKEPSLKIVLGEGYLKSEGDQKSISRDLLDAQE